MKQFGALVKFIIKETCNPIARHELMVRPHLDNSHWVANHWPFGAVESSLQSLEWCFAEGGGCYGTCYLVEYLVMYALEILFGISGYFDLNILYDLDNIIVFY